MRHDSQKLSLSHRDGGFCRNPTILYSPNVIFMKSPESASHPETKCPPGSIPGLWLWRPLQTSLVQSPEKPTGGTHTSVFALCSLAPTHRLVHSRLSMKHLLNNHVRNLLLISKGGSSFILPCLSPPLLFLLLDDFSKMYLSFSFLPPIILYIEKYREKLMDLEASN